MTILVIVNYISYDVYIGRANQYYQLDRSKYANPFEIGKDGTREKVLEKYNQYLTDNPQLIDDAIRELDGKVLGCYCSPLRCHGDILKERIEQRKKELCQ